MPTVAPLPTYLATVLPGLEGVLSAEIAAKLPGCRSEGATRGKVYFSCIATPDFSALRTADNVYLRIGGVRAGPHRDDLPALAVAVRGLPFPVVDRPRPTFWVNGSRVGRQTYSRFAAAAAATEGIAERFPDWQPGTPERADLEFRLDVQGPEALLSLRLTPPTFRYRTAGRAFSPAALRPTVAHGLIWLSRPAAADRFLDPFCGSGTLLAERLAYPAAAVYGGDVSPLALAAARQNLGDSDRVVLRVWDATSLPLERHSVDRVVSNLPFGRQITAAEGIPALYTGFARELRRVLAPTGTAILLTDQGEALQEATARHGLACEEVLLLSLKGRHPRVYRVTP